MLLSQGLYHASFTDPNTNDLAQDSEQSRSREVPDLNQKLNDTRRSARPTGKLIVNVFIAIDATCSIHASALMTRPESRSDATR